MEGRRRRRRRNSNSNDGDGNVFHGIRHEVRLGEFGRTDMQVAITESNRREDASFTIRVGKASTTEPYQQTIPIDFSRCYKNLLKERLTLECPTGRTWNTVLHDSFRVVRFGRGWRNFSRENHLQEGYQLLFTLVGRLRFLVQFFDHLGKRCTSYPPLPSSQPGSVPVAETQREPDLQPGSQSGFQEGVDGEQASHRHGNEGHTSAAVPLMETTPNSAILIIPDDSDEDNDILRQYEPELPSQSSLPANEHMTELGEHTFDAGEGSEDMEIDDEELDDAQNDIFHGSDMDEATMQTFQKTELSIHALNEISRGKQPKFHSPDNRAHSEPQMIQDHNNSPSSGDELPFHYYSELQKEPVGVKCPPPVATPVASHQEAGGSSRSSPAMRELHQQGCMRFSQIVLKCERRDVSDQERRVVVDAAKRFVSAMDIDEMFLVVMRDEQVYHKFHLVIPEKMLEATGTERNSKVEVCLLDTEQALYKTHWTKKDFCDTPLLERDAWAKFAVDHSLQEGDVCVFQLMQPEPAVSMSAFLFLVHIFRVVETPVGQLDFSDAVDNK